MIEHTLHVRALQAAGEWFDERAARCARKGRGGPPGTPPAWRRAAAAAADWLANRLAAAPSQTGS